MSDRRRSRRQLDGPISVASSTARSQPRRACQGCRRQRPTRPVRGLALCTDCAHDVDLATRPLPPPSAGDLS